MGMGTSLKCCGNKVVKKWPMREKGTRWIQQGCGADQITCLTLLNSNSQYSYIKIAIKGFLLAQWQRIHCQSRRCASIPDPRRSHATEQLSQCATEQVRKPHLVSPHVQPLKPVHPRACAPQQERPWQWEATATRDWLPLQKQRKSLCSRDPEQPK